jgi:oxepin-CoA hydrolase/3-oxo-5,6-dehydrosuberyl-CoA semialdehyde dehydrogenase
MARLTRESLPQVLARLERIESDRQPQWGKMNTAQLFGHLHQVVRYTMQTEVQMPFKGNWKSRWIFRPLILNGVVKIPKNIRVPRMAGQKVAPPPPEASYGDLQLALDDYLAAQEAGTLPSACHPFFGNLSAQDWSRFHWRHFDHHCRQFGV